MDINLHNKNLIYKIFPRLDNNHKKYIIDSINEICVVIEEHIFKKDTSTFVSQMKLNDSKDILGFIILLLPYFNFFKCYEIESLDDIFKDTQSSKKVFSENNFQSTYYLDHNTKDYKIKDYEEYFRNNTQKIINTIYKVKHKLQVNWINIFPYNYEELIKIENNDLYKNLSKLYFKKEFNLVNQNELLLGYDTLFGTISNFLYNDIFPIKWMIYDEIISENILIPSIVVISDLLKIRDILVEDYNINEKKKSIFRKLSEVKQKSLSDNWFEVIKEDKNKNILKNLILFYLRYEYDKDKLNKIIKNDNCKKIIKTKFEKEIVEVEDDKDEIGKNISDCISEIIGNLDFEDIYNYIFSCLQQFNYTWYGFICIHQSKKIVTSKEYIDIINNYFINETNSLTKLNPNYKESIMHKSLMSLKVYYNYFKALLHVSASDEKKNKYINIGKTWDELTSSSKEIFISKLNDKNIDNLWFNIPKNLKRNFSTIEDKKLQKTMKAIRGFIYSKTFIPRIIISTLLYNGILTEFKFNQKITDTTQMPDKKTDYTNWRKHIIDNLSIEDYANKSYSFLSNTKYSEIPKSIEDIKDTLWFTNFGGDWVAQIQLYHHFINQRIIITTAATGAGKSTVIPFILLYALKILNYNNNGKVFCTQPRTQPTEDNTTRISQSLGYKYNYIEDSNKKKKLKKKIITYIQYKHQKDETVDDYYHPTLRMLTDGSLYAQINNNILFKTKAKEEDKEKYRKNLFDILLIDEAHEHNTYMDMLLTLSRYNIYINNQITLGIISATIDYDEPIYRRYFKNIDDNLKFPLKIKDIYNDNLDSNLIDRRLHLGAPFSGTNFPIKEIIRDGEETITILNEILAKSTKGDILIFKSGQAEIKELIIEINKNSPSDVLAIPFYSEIPEDKLELIKNIAKVDIRNKFRYPKKYSIMDKVQEKDLLQEGYYKRFVIVATNIAEASITIDTLEYVIDDGNQKTNYYDYLTKTYNLKMTKISKSNRLQRKGRVGRVKPGTAYYTYDISNLSDRVIYKLCIENITTFITNLISINSTTVTTKKINSKNDPNIIDDIINIFDDIKKSPEDKENNERNLYYQKEIIPIYDEDIDKALTLHYNYHIKSLPEDIFSQYNINYFVSDDYDINNNTCSIINFTYLFIITNSKKKIDIDIEKVFYPDNEGKYDYNDIIDRKGKFYVINPDEDLFIRNKELTILNIEEENNKSYIIELDKKNNYEIVKKDGKVKKIKEYYNKIKLIIEYLKELKIIENINLTNFGILVQKISSKLFLEFPQRIESIMCILDLIKNYDDIDYHYIILLIIYMEGSKFMFSNEITKIIRNNKSDILNIAEIIPKKKIYDRLNLETIIDEIKDDNSNLEKLIIDNTNNIIDNFVMTNPSYFIDTDDIKVVKFLVSKYNLLKIKISQLKDKFIKQEFNKDHIEISKNNEFYIYDDYERMCYFAVKYYNSNLLVNIPRSSFYCNYRNPNIKKIYEISKNFKGTKHFTSVYKYYRYNYILYCSNNDANMLQTISYIPYKIINKFIEDNKLIIKKNEEKVDLEEIKKINIENFNEIIKKIDIIIKYINTLH
jgi:hypothetical protein